MIDPHTRLVEVTTPLAPRGKYSSADFSLTYWEGDSNPIWKGGQNTTWPISMVLAGELFDLDSGLQTKEWTMETRGKVVDIELVFIVPADLGQSTLLFKNQPAGKTLSI